MVIFEYLIENIELWTRPMAQVLSFTSHGWDQYLQHSYIPETYTINNGQLCSRAILFSIFWNRIWLPLYVSYLWRQDRFGIQPHTVQQHACPSQRHLNEGPATKMPRDFPDSMKREEIRGKNSWRLKLPLLAAQNTTPAGLLRHSPRCKDAYLGVLTWKCVPQRPHHCEQDTMTPAWGITEKPWSDCTLCIYFCWAKRTCKTVLLNHA